MKTVKVMVGLMAAVLIESLGEARAISAEWPATARYGGGVFCDNVPYGWGVRPAVIHRARIYHHQPAQRVMIRHHPERRAGYYEWRCERVWVPGRWVYEEMRCGNRRKVWRPGCHEMVRRKVWVSLDCDGRW